MLNNLLKIAPQEIINEDGTKVIKYYFDNFGEAALYALIGFVVVFVGIVIIIAIIWLVGLLMRKTNNLEFLTNLGKKKVKVTETSAPATEDNLPAAKSDDIPDEVKAAIIAAIMAYYLEKEDKCQFTVKRIKRI